MNTVSGFVRMAFACVLAFMLSAAADSAADSARVEHVNVDSIGADAVPTAPLMVQAAVARSDRDRLMSTAQSNSGWRSLRAHQLEAAVRHFNQAWVMDRDNYDAYWGLGAVLQLRGQIDDAIAMVEYANRLPDIDARNRAPLLSDLGNLYAIKAMLLPRDAGDRSATFARANAIFAAAASMDPDNPQPWLQWIISLLYQERYMEAWAKVSAAQTLGHRVPDEVLVALPSRKADEALPLR